MEQTGKIQFVSIRIRQMAYTERFRMPRLAVLFTTQEQLKDAINLYLEHPETDEAETLKVHSG
jgi:Holliday junction resolvase-like predicted endonuclease